MLFYKYLLKKNNKEIKEKNINIKKFDNIDNLLSITAKLLAKRKYHWIFSRKDGMGAQGFR